MNQKILLKTARWAWRVFLLILGVGTVMIGGSLLLMPETAVLGVLLMVAGVCLPGAEVVFYLLKEVEKKL